MSVPESIRSALAGHTRRRSLGVRMPVSRGQVRRISHPEADPSERMVLVVRVDAERDFAEIMLVHPYTELAVGADLIVPVDHSTIPYPTVVQTDTRAAVWLYQLETQVGELDSETLEALGGVAAGTFAAGGTFTTGMPLAGQLDPRWDFKAREGDAVRSFAADCTQTLLYDGPPFQLDPGCLAPQLLAGSSDFKSIAQRLLDMISTYDIEFDMSDVSSLEDIGALRAGNWTDNFGPLGHEMYGSFWPLVEQALTTMELPANLIDDGSMDEGSAERRIEAGSFRRREGRSVISAGYVSIQDAGSYGRSAHGKDLFRLIDV